MFGYTLQSRLPRSGSSTGGCAARRVALPLLENEVQREANCSLVSDLVKACSYHAYEIFKIRGELIKV